MFGKELHLFKNITIGADYSNNWSEYLLSGVCIIAALTSLINVSVFVNSELKDQIYKYYFTSSLFDLFYVIILAFYVFTVCGTLCEYRVSLLSTQIYWLYFTDFITSCLAIINVMIDLFLSLQRLFMISNKKHLQNLKAKNVLFVLVFLGLIYYIPVLFIKKIVLYEQQIEPNSTTKQIKYKLEYTEFGNSIFGRIIPLILSSLRILMASVILFFINLVTLSRFKSHFNKKTNIKFHKSSKFFFKFMN